MDTIACMHVNTRCTPDQGAGRAAWTLRVMLCPMTGATGCMHATCLALHPSSLVHTLWFDASLPRRVAAFAGTGKTTTLLHLATAHPSLRILYTAYNKDVVLSAEAKFPGNVVCAWVAEEPRAPLAIVAGAASPFWLQPAPPLPHTNMQRHMQQQRHWRVTCTRIIAIIPMGWVTCE